MVFGKAEAGRPLYLGIEAWDGTTHVASFAQMDGDYLRSFRPPAASGPSWILWSIVGAFFVAAGAPAVIWLVRLR
jgi:hypothetical protein